MAAELLQILSAAKSLNDQATDRQYVQALNQHSRLIDQQTGLLNHQAKEIDQLKTVVQQHSDTAATIAGQNLAIAKQHALATGAGVAGLLFAVFATAIVIIRLHRRIQLLEARISPALHGANSGTEPTGRR